MAGIKISELPPNTLPLVGDEQLELEDASGDSTRATVADIAASAAGLDATFVTVTANAALPNERILTEGNGISIVDNGAGNSIVVSATSGGLSGLGEWRYRTETGTPPANGQIRFDNADPTLATELYIAETNDGSVDVGAFLGLLTAGSLIYIQEKSDSANFIVVEVGTNTDSGTFATIGIANLIQQGSALSQNTRVILVINLTGAATGANVVAGTVDGQVTIWDIGNNQYEPVISSSILINPATPPTSPLGRISGGGSSTTDVRKAFIHVNIGASVGPVWSTDRNGGTPSGFYSRSAMNSSPIVHDWGFWNPGNQTGVPLFRMTDDSEFIFNVSSFYDERAAALSSVAARGQVWVRDDVPNVLMYTDDAGSDFVLNGGAAGDVFKVGTPVDNQVGVWTGDGTIEGDPSFTYDKSTQTFGFNSTATIFSDAPLFSFQDGSVTLDGQLTTTPTLSISQSGINNFSIAIQTGQWVFSGNVPIGAFNVSGDVVRWEFEGIPVRVIGGGGTDYVEQSHDNTDYNFTAFQTVDINFTGLTGRIKQDAETLAFLSEITGDVSKVGTPVDNQVGVWTGDGTIEGTTGLTYDGAALDVTGNITLTGTVDGIDIATDVPANTAKVTNATHTGQVTGATALALDVTAITAQPASGAIAAADTIITNDGGVLSEATFTQLLTFFDANLSFLAFPEFQFFADQLENPNNADWTVNALAPASADSNNAGLTVRLFDDTTEEGVGFTIEVPAGATNIVFDFVARAETAPGIANTVGLDIYNRGIPDNAAVQAWSSATQLTDLDIPTNEFFQEDTQTVALATLGVTAGETTQFELVRVAPTGGTDLTGDWDLLLCKVSFT